MTKNNWIFYFAQKPKIYEVAKTNEIDRRMGKENDIKQEKNIKQNCSYGDSDNLQYFLLLLLDTISIIYRFHKIQQIYQFLTLK